MKRKIAALLLVLIMCMSVFTGCSLFQTDEKAYYEAVVGKITYTTGEVENITKRELLMAYNSYGYNYVDNYGYTREKAMKVTLDSIIDNKLKIKHVDNYYKSKETNPNNEPMYNEREYTYLWNSTFEALFGNLQEYYKQVVGNSSSSSNNQNQSTDKSVYVPYESKVYFAKTQVKVGQNEQGQDQFEEKLVIKLKDTESSIRDSYDTKGVVRNYETKVDGGKQPDKEVMYENLMALVGKKETESQKNWNNALKKYLEAIRENYKYLDLKDDEKCLKFEMDRVYNILKENYTVQKYSDLYSKKDGISTVSVDEILKSYTSKVMADYTTYKLQGSSEYDNKMLSDISNMDYVLENDASQFFYVGWLKMNLDERTTAKIKELQEARDAGSINDYDDQVKELYKMVYANIRNEKTGEKTGKTIDSASLRTEIAGVLEGKYLSETTDDEELNRQNAEKNKLIEIEKAEAFRKYLYLYNDDDTLKGADYNTVFGVDKNGKVLAGDTFKEKTEILEAVEKLYNNAEAKVGDLSEIVMTEDGAYLFFYAGAISNIFTVTDNFDASNQEENVKLLAKTRINIFSKKTVFDVLYDELSQGSYSVFESMHINFLRSSLASKIEAIENNMKDLY